MAYLDLQALLASLERDGDLARVRVPVDPHLEVTAIVQRVVRERGPALLFEHPTRGQMPLAINVFGTHRRMAKALGVDNLDEIGARIADLLKPELPRGVGGFKDALAKVGQLRAVPPRHVSSAPCQEIVLRGKDVDLNALPGIHAWPEDGGVFLNLGLTHTKHPDTGARNLGMYRLQMQDERTVSLHWQIHKDSTSHAAVAERRGERLPVAIAFGCPPAVTYAASAPLPAEIDEYLFAGFVQRERVDMVDCVSVPLQVPAAAQVVLEGWVEPGERLPEGPFGDHTGFYTPVEPFPFMRVETMTMRVGPHLSVDHRRAAAPGGRSDRQGDRTDLPAADPDDGSRDRRLRPARGRRVPQLLHRVDRQAIPETRAEGDERDLGRGAAVAVEADRRRRRRLRCARLRRGRVARIRQRRLRPRRAAHDGPVDHLDHASYEQFFGGKLGIDATRKLPTEGYHRAGGWPLRMRLGRGDHGRRRAALARIRHRTRAVDEHVRGAIAPRRTRAGAKVPARW